MQGEELKATLPGMDELEQNIQQLATYKPGGSDAIVTDIQYILSKASSLTVENDQDQQNAVTMIQALKTRKYAVTEFFGPSKKAAFEAHRLISGRERLLLAPLTKAEDSIKAKLSDYVRRVEIERAEMVHAAQEAMAKRAEELLDDGHIDAAVNLETMAKHVTVAPQEKPSGMSTGVDWDIVIEDPEAVPVNFMGVEIRPIDEKAIRRLVKASKGKLSIPGVSVVQKDRVIVRRS